MKLNKLLASQLKKHLPESIKYDELPEQFINAINDSYNDFEKEILFGKRIHDIIEEEYSEINSKLNDEIQEKVEILSDLKKSFKLLADDFTLPSDIDISSVIDHIKKQILFTKNIEKTFVTLIDNLQTGVLLLSPEGKLSYINKTFCNLFDLEIDESRNFDNDYEVIFKQSGLSKLEKVTLIKFLKTHILLNKSIIDKHFELNPDLIFEVDLIPITTDDIYQGHLCQFKDVTKRISSEKELRQQKHFFESILNNVPADIAVFSPQHKYLFVNPNGIKDNFLREWIIGKDDFDYCKLKKTDYQMAQLRKSRFEKTVEEKTSTEWEDQHIDVQGNLNAIYRKFFPYFENDILQFVIGYGIDITKLKVSENKLNATLKSLEENNAELKRFAYIASHDLQEPLRMVTSFLGLIEKRLQDKLDEETKKFIHFAIDGAVRMKKLIKDLLEYSRVGIENKEFEKVELSELIAYVLQMLKLNIEEKKALVTVQQMPSIVGYKTLLQQLFLNMLTNSLKYTKGKKPIIEIGVSEDSHYWIFFIRDNGIGIEKQYHEEIFVIFKRLHNNSEYSGTGIGLSICKKIIEAHNGKIWVESSIDKGSTFYFTISKNINHEKSKHIIN